MNLADILMGIAYDEFLTGQLLISGEGIRFEILRRGVRVIWDDDIHEYQNLLEDPWDESINPFND
jgi:hypothetical protein